MDQILLELIETYQQRRVRLMVYYILLINYMNPSFRDFLSYLRMFSPLDENDIRLIFKQYISKFTTYKLPPGA